ncbi:MAG: ABC transporter permease [Chitinophagaceae bacterium]|nr:ABC transporter permease [Oligoflexus sp.]
MRESLALIIKVAFRNLWLYRLKSTVIAGLLCMGSFIGIVGLSLLHDVEHSMQDSIISSVAGHLQAYSSKAKDDLALFGGAFMGRADVGTIPNLASLRDVVKQNTNVADFIPMGSDMAMLGRGNELDETLTSLRGALKKGETDIIAQRKDELKFLFLQLERELTERAKLSADKELMDRYRADLNHALEPDFLGTLNALDEEKLLFLDTHIAPISGEKQPIYLMYLGTDIQLFKQNFPKFKLVEGEPLGPGQRGILISYKVRETQLKAVVARLFDELKKRIDRVRVPIKGDVENERAAADLPKQYQQILSSLDRHKADVLSEFLKSIGIKPKSAELITGLKEQLQEFLQVDDTNFQERYKQFYAQIAPKMKLYEISPGETIVLRSYTKSGYLKSVPLKVFGVYTFEGLEDSDLAGVMNITDLITFRELYGEMNEESKKELEAMRVASSTVVTDAAGAEDALFGAGASASVPSVDTHPVETKTDSKKKEILHIKPVISDVFPESEIQKGLALNGAIRLKDGSKIKETRAELNKLLKEAGIEAKLVDWQEATGIVGQFANIVRLVLIFALGVIFLVALVIINNSIIVGTLNRTKEIGTMRAIGAQKSFVLGLFLAETAITGLIGSIIGATLATVFLFTLHIKGIPAPNDIVSFLFSGPRLYPTLQWNLVMTTPFVVSLVATIASIYAARHAAHVKPAEAMQEKE